MDIDLKALTKGELRKLNALRKSIGEDLANNTFVKWLKSKPKRAGKGVVDASAAKIEEVVWALVKDKSVLIPKGGYVLKRGRGRVIVAAVTVRERSAKGGKKKK
jgi:hypothetical protein